MFFVAVLPLVAQDNHKTVSIPFEALNDDLLDIHLCDPFAAGGAADWSRETSERVELVSKDQEDLTGRYRYVDDNMSL